MKKIRYEEICRFEKIYKAYRLAARGKRNTKEVIRFELDLSANLCKIEREMEEKKYKIKGYNKFMIYDPKERAIHSLCFKDRVVQRCLCDNIVQPEIDKRLIYDNAACRIGKGTHFAMNRLTEFLRRHYRKYGTRGYILKYDMRHYFERIDHGILKEKLKIFKDMDVRRLLNNIVDSYEVEEGRGLPLGNQTSQWFALYYTDEVDRYIKEKRRIKYYTRYMDDGVMIHESKEYLKETLEGMKEIVHKLKLEFNEKTQIFPLSQGVEYLGFRFYLTETGKVVKRLRTSNKKRFKRRLKKFQEEYRTGKKTLEEIKRSLASYKGHLEYGHTYRLRKKVYKKFVLRRGD